MYQRRFMPGFFHFVNQPVPVPYSLDGNGRTGGKSLQKRAELLPVMLYSLSRKYFSSFTNCCEYRVFLVGITSSIIFHGLYIFLLCFLGFTHLYFRRFAALSYNQ